MTSEPRYTELNKVKVNAPDQEVWEGYVIGSQFKDGNWIYKLSMMEENNLDSFDCWFPEQWLERTR